MIIRNSAAVLIALLISSCTSCSFFTDNTQMGILPFEPFVMDSNKIILSQISPCRVLVIDTLSDSVIRSIKFTNGGSIYSVIAGNKIYATDSGTPVKNSYTVIAVYPDTGSGKSIRLEQPLQSDMIYNKWNKTLLVSHYFSDFDPASTNRGGDTPYSLIDTTTDTFIKDIWDWDIYFYIETGQDGRYYGSKMSEWPPALYSVDMNNVSNKTTLDTNTGWWAQGGWHENDETSALIVGDTLFMLQPQTNLIRMFSTSNQVWIGDITVTGKPFTNNNCLGYDPVSNYLFAGGENLAVIDLNTSNVVKWITNYTTQFKLNNQKIYFYSIFEAKIHVFGITNGFQWIKDIDVPMAE